MRILVVGGGGREHAIIKKLNENSSIDKIFALPGNAGMTEAVCVDIKSTDIDAVVNFAKENDIDYAVVAPDDPLVLGMVDSLEDSGIACFGPGKRAAIIEGSKSFSKSFMKKYNIPTADYEVFDDSNQALSYIKRQSFPIVIKADGLALGKGVIIANSLTEATDAVNSIMVDKKFGKSGDSIVIEEFLEGMEVSILAFTDGNTLIPMLSSMDHKLSGDNDTGTNTGGMGAVAPNPYYTDDIADECMRTIFIPTMEGMNKEGRRFKGCLYFGLMLTRKGPKVIEYNCRFGDPETQVILPLLKSDLFTIMQAVTQERLEKSMVEFSDKSSCCVIMASDGYPKLYEKGFEITVPGSIRDRVFFAGAVNKDGKLLTNSGRVLGATAVADTLDSAIKEAYSLVSKIDFENAYYRKDIGQKALMAKGR